MSLTSAGADVAMVRNSATGKYDLSWDTSGSNAGNPKFTDDNVHRVLSLLVEHRGSPDNPGWAYDTTGKRGSLLYTLRNLRKSTPSQAEAYALDAMDKGVQEGWFTNPSATAKRDGSGKLLLNVAWTNRDKSAGTLRVGLTD